MLGLYGVGALAGLTIGGRNADRAPFTVPLAGMGSFAAVAVVLAVTANSAWAAIPLVVVLGAAEFSVTPAVNASVFSPRPTTHKACAWPGAYDAAPAQPPLMAGVALRRLRHRRR
ncbi:hypothetical protein ACFXKC_42410 [Streptomyces sp. NPDC059340]|uniref:hypothetical protein n=1 Tax=Streptomyces sp. NPDC059340 TaxID=3346806 RepID=UPI003679E1E2